MPPRATKRRKLSHDSSDESASENGRPVLAKGANGALDSDEEVGEDVIRSGDEDEELDDAEESDGDEDEDMGEGESESEGGEESEDEDEHEADKKKEKGQQKNAGKSNARRKSGLLEDGVYTSEIYKSNMFKLQVDQLIKQVKPKYGNLEGPLGEALHALKGIIEQIPAREPLSVPDAERTLIKSAKVAVPFPQPRPPKDAKYKLQYSKPSSVNVVGSYPLKTATKTTEPLAVDLLVTMPSSIFTEKDYLNHRYFYKRAFYLACIAAGIKQAAGKQYKLKFETLNGNPLQPIIAVEGGEESKPGLSASKCRINILLGVSEGMFPAEKLSPNRNCVRPKSTGEDTSTKVLPPTPVYNASLRMDGLMTSYLKLFHGAATRCEGYKEACMLGRVWLRQRGFSSNVPSGGFGNFEWAALIAVLLQSSGSAGSTILSPGYSSYQMFKAALQFLATRDLCRQPFTSNTENAPFTKSNDKPIFFDAARSINILFKMSPWSYSMLQHEARRTVKMLGDPLSDHFDATFAIRADAPLYRFDKIITIPLSAFGIPNTDDEYETKLYERLGELYNVLRRGLTDRARLIYIEMPPRTSWEANAAAPVYAVAAEIHVGILVAPDRVERFIERGPSAENKKEAQSFRKFWGEKAQLRRFNDGNIQESLEWSKKESVPSVFEQIVTYLLQRHFSKAVSDSAKFFGGQFGRIVRGVNGPAAFRTVMDAFSKLEKDLRGLEDLPLHFRHVFAAGPQLGYSSVDVPLQGTPPHMSEPADVVVEFEGSTRWPEDLAVIQKTKIAFLLKIAELLEEQVTNVQTRVGLENEERGDLNQAFMDVIYPSAAWFRVRIRVDREEAMLERLLRNKLLDAKTKENAASAMAIYKRTMLRAPAHEQALQTLSTRFPAISGSIRLARKWFAAHHLTPHIQGPVIDLMVVRAFSQPYPWDVPTSPATGFLRTLFFLSRWDWRQDPLVVDLSEGDLKADGLSAITTRFEAWRKLDPAMNRVVLFVASNVDPDGTTWTDHASPSKVLAGRMTALARAACQEVSQQGLSLVPESLFVPSMGDYDFLIHISPGFTRVGRDKKRTQASEGGSFKNLQIQPLAASSKDMDLFAQDPVSLFFQDLVQSYGQCALFFYDELKGTTIAGLWNPTAATKRTWRAKIGYSTVPVKLEMEDDEEKLQVTLNKDAVLAEIARVGGDLVKTVEVVKH